MSADEPVHLHQTKAISGGNRNNVSPIGNQADNMTGIDNYLSGKLKKEGYLHQECMLNNTGRHGDKHILMIRVIELLLAWQ